MEDAIAESAGAIAEMINLGTNLTCLYLSDRDGLSASATLVLNRVYREDPLRLTARRGRRCQPIGNDAVGTQFAQHRHRILKGMN